MGLRIVGTKFVTKGFSSFVSQLNTVDKTYKKLGQSINLTGNNITAFGAKLRVFVRGGKAYSQWVDEASGSFLSHIEVQRRFQNQLASSRGALYDFARSFNVVSFSKLGLAIAAIAAAFGALKIGINVAKAAINGLITIVKAAVSPFVALGKAVFDVARNIGNFFIGDIVSGISSSLNKIKNDIGQTVSSFQTLEIQYESLIARQLRAQDSTLTVADSLKLAASGAQELLDWVKQIAVTTPFEVETIAKTVAFAQAIGFTVGESKNVTTAIINFTSAMGLNQETMERIIQNFGQMRAAGKVTGTELRDLARGALVPVNDILKRMAENMNIATEDLDDFKKAAAEGAAPVDEFFKAFIDVANESFPNAAERMSRTFEGVKNNIIDFFKTVVGVEALGPVFDRITGLMADALDRLLTPGVRQQAVIIGESLLQGFNQVYSVVQTKLLPALSNLARAFGITGIKGYGFSEVIARISAVLSVGVEKISEFINELANSLSGKFDNVAENAKAWGFNIIGSLAEGMAAAAKFVVQVLIDLGNIIASWLQPGSPPKLLPKLDQWGAAAMTEYMKGWLAADFSVFQDIADTIESFIRSISGTILDKTNVVPTILAVRDRLAKVMDEIKKSGKASSDAIKSVFDALKGGTPSLIKYVELQIKLAEANNILVKAQEELNAVTEKYEAILAPLKKRLDDITDSASDLDDARRITQLRLVLTDVNASTGDKERARLEIEKLLLQQQIRGVENEKDKAVDAAQEKVDAAQKNVDIIADQVEAQEALLKVQIDTNNLIKEQIDLLEQLKKSAGGGLSDLLDGLFGGIGEDELSRKTGGLLILKDKISGIFDEMKKNVGASIDELVGKFDGLGTSLKELADTWGALGSLFENSKLRDIMRRISLAAGDLKENTDNLFDSFGNLIQKLLELIGLNTGKISFGFRDIALSMIENFFLENLAQLNAIVVSLTEAVNGFIERVQNVQDAWKKLIDVQGLKDFIVDLINLALAILDLGSAVSFFKNIVTGWTSGYNEIAAESYRDIELKTQTHKEEMTKKYEETADEIEVEVSRWTEQTQQYVKDANGEIVKNTEEMSDEMVGKSIIPDMVDNILKEFDDMKTGIVGEQGSFTTLASTLLSDADKLATNIFTKGANIVQGLWDGMTSIMEPFLKWLQDKYAFILSVLDIISKSGSPSKVMIDKGVNLMKSLAMGIEKAIALPEVAMQSATTRVLDAQPLSGGSTSTVNNNYTLNMPTTANPNSVGRAFNVMSVMSR